MKTKFTGLEDLVEDIKDEFEAHGMMAEALESGSAEHVVTVSVRVSLNCHVEIV